MFYVWLHAGNLPVDKIDKRWRRMVNSALPQYNIIFCKYANLAVINELFNNNNSYLIYILLYDRFSYIPHSRENVGSTKWLLQQHLRQNSTTF